MLTLIEKVEDPIVKAQYFSQFQKTLVRETKETKPKHSEPPVNLEKIFNRFTKAKKEITVNDLQHEIKETKSEIRTLREEVKKLEQALTILRIEHNFLNRRIKHQDHISHQGNNVASLSYQNSSDDEIENVYDESSNPTTNMVLEKPAQKYIDIISRIDFQKWHSKVKIVISKDFEFEVIALIDSGADLNCIQEGIIPSKYFQQTRERLSSANGSKMQMKYKIPKAHVC